MAEAGTAQAAGTAEGLESVEAFTARASAWIAANLPSTGEAPVDHRELQARIFDGGFGGIGFPAEYGGAGLTAQHQRAFYDEIERLARQSPTRFQVSIGMLGPTLLDHASEEAKRRLLPPLLRGDDMWIQLLSEPSGGSDMASATTRLTRDGDTFVLTGAKMWSSAAHEAEYGLCLCRLDWSVPKHKGLAMVAVPLRDTPGVTIQQTRAVDGELGHFCEVFLDDVVLPADNLVGGEGEGWAVAQTLLKHERNGVGGIGLGYLGPRPRTQAPGKPKLPTPTQIASSAAAHGNGEVIAPLLADVYINSVVTPLTAARISTGLRVGTHQGPWGSLGKLQASKAIHDAALAAMATDAADGVIFASDAVEVENTGTEWLGVRRATIAGGTSEIQRNIISERLIGLPREPADDRDVPFNQVVRRSGS
jgi:alkylation response protein AidB-like acyl-CoA dehydrogenase